MAVSGSRSRFSWQCRVQGSGFGLRFVGSCYGVIFMVRVSGFEVRLVRFQEVGYRVRLTAVSGRGGTSGRSPGGLGLRVRVSGL